MNRAEVLKKLETLPYPREDYWVVAGAAMVLYGLREETHDVDLGCTTEMADRLEQSGCPCRTMPDGKRHFKISEDVEAFENWLYDRVETVSGAPVISLGGLLEMKRRLGREKDQRDIRLIREYLGRQREK